MIRYQRFAGRVASAAEAGLLLCWSLSSLLLSTHQASAAEAPRSSAPVAPRTSAPVDLTGTWVSVVSEDWRWRMLTPAKGDHTSVPLNEAGRKLLNSWDESQVTADAQACRAYGPPALIREPGRLRISWAGDSTLKLEFEAGTQTRLLNFSSVDENARDSVQGVSKAEWEMSSKLPKLARPEAKPSEPTGSLLVRTTGMRAGYLRRNGVPYSDKATVVEYFDRAPAEINSDEWLIVTTIVEDPTFLTQPFIYTTQFKRDSAASKWKARPCEVFPSAKPTPQAPNARQSS